MIIPAQVYALHVSPLNCILSFFQSIHPAQQDHFEF